MIKISKLKHKSLQLSAIVLSPIASHTIHSTTKIHFRLSGAQARTDARSDHAVLDLFGYFFIKKKVTNKNYL